MPEVIDKSDKKRNIFKIRQPNLHTEEQAGRKIILKEMHFDTK